MLALGILLPRLALVVLAPARKSRIGLARTVNRFQA